MRGHTLTECRVTAKSHLGLIGAASGICRMVWRTDRLAENQPDEFRLTVGPGLPEYRLQSRTNRARREVQPGGGALNRETFGQKADEPSFASRGDRATP